MQTFDLSRSPRILLAYAASKGRDIKTKTQLLIYKLTGASATDCAKRDCHLILRLQKAKNDDNRLCLYGSTDVGGYPGNQLVSANLILCH